MRRLTSALMVKAPSTFALAYMQTYFLARPVLSSGAELSLRFPLPRFIIDGLTIEKRVSVHLKYSSAGAGNHPLTIGWTPVGSGPLPSFEGVLAATVETATSCCLTIAGSYDPPGGSAGAVFDRLIGVRIARATLAALLEQFGRAIENDYAVRVMN